MTSTQRASVGVIGGSGFYAFEGLSEVERLEPATPFGAPSSAVVAGTLHGHRVAFISRHAEGHRLLPSELPARANIFALKALGVERVLAVSAVGSLQEQFAPLHAVVPDQLIDRTQGRASTFFGEGVVTHIGFADPFCPQLAEALAGACERTGVTTHRGGTLVVIEGLAFSTRAESELYRSWGAAVIGMTALPEAKLAREAELCYGSLCFVTDYDVWHAHAEDVSVELVMANLQQNAKHARAAVAGAIGALEDERRCACGDALATAVVTARELVPRETRKRLAPLLERYWGAAP